MLSTRVGVGRLWSSPPSANRQLPGVRHHAPSTWRQHEYRSLDIACGAGLAVELARYEGHVCGPRRVTTACRDRSVIGVPTPTYG